MLELKGQFDCRPDIRLIWKQCDHSVGQGPEPEAGGSFGVLVLDRVRSSLPRNCRRHLNPDESRGRQPVS